MGMMGYARRKPELITLGLAREMCSTIVERINALHNIKIWTALIDAYAAARYTSTSNYYQCNDASKGSFHFEILARPNWRKRAFSVIEITDEDIAVTAWSAGSAVARFMHMDPNQYDQIANLIASIATDRWPKPEHERTTH